MSVTILHIYLLNLLLTLLNLGHSKHRRTTGIEFFSIRFVQRQNRNKVQSKTANFALGAATWRT